MIYHLLYGGQSDVLEQQILALHEGAKQHRLDDGSIVFYTGEHTEGELQAWADKIKAEDEALNFINEDRLL